MKSVSIQSDSNWHTVEPKYGPDSFLKMSSQDIETKEGVQLNMSYVMKNVTDIKMNNDTQMVLSDNMRMDKLFEPDLGISEYPLQFTTVLEGNAFPFYTGWSSYVKVVEAESDDDFRFYVMGNRSIDDGLTASSEGLVEATETQTSIDNWPLTNNQQTITSFRHKTDPADDNGIFYTVTLLNDNQLTIMHDDNYADVYLTMNRSKSHPTEYYMYFATAAQSDPDDRTFNYLYNPSTGFLTLYRVFGDFGIYYLSCELDIPTKRSQLKFIQTQPGNFPIPKTAIFRTVPYSKNTPNLKINNHWVSYSTYGEQNNLNINEKKSYKNVYNNFLFSVPFKTITETDADYSTLQLKNQLTPEYEQSRANPFPFYRDCDHREYDKIFSGTNQIQGTNQLSLGYNSYVSIVDLPPDQITYFNAPQDMYPVKKININDSGLIEAGAIGGDSPIVSDKIFKKAADYKYNTPYGAPTDEESGVWLCSWLKTNIGTDWDPRPTYKINVIVNYENKTYKCLIENQNVKPDLDKNIWEHIRGGEPVWVDRYYNPEYYSAEEALKVEGQYYDYTSKFEYIIQKFNAEQEYVFDKRSDLTFEPGSLYAYYRIGPKENQSIIDTERATLIHEGVTPSYYQNREINPLLSDTLNLDGQVYVETTSLNKTPTSDFTISLNIKTEDWSKPLGSQIVGNFTNQGIGLFNKLNTTPFSVLHDKSNVYVYNTDFVLLSQITIQETTGDNGEEIMSVSHLEGSENLHILTKLESETENTTYTVYQYDMKGMRVEQFSIPYHGSDIVSMNVDIENYYFLLANNDVKKHNINNEREDLLFKYRLWPKSVVGDPGDTDVNQIPFNDTGTIQLEPYKDNVYRINCEKYTIDMNNNIWFTKNNVGTVYKNVASLPDGRAAAYREVINGQLLYLISTEIKQGETQGNQIILTGDGTRTIADLISEWNANNPGNTVESLSEAGERLILSDGQSIQLFGGADQGDDTNVYALSGQTDHEISSIKADTDNYIWLLCNQELGTTLYKMDTDRRIIFTKKLEDIDTNLTPGLTGLTNMDLIYEFNQGVERKHACIFVQEPDTTTCTIIKVDDNGEHVSTTTQDMPGLAFKNISEYNCLTNYEVMKRLFYDEQNSFTFKLKYQSYFDTDKTYTKYVKHNISDLTTGEHHFSVSFNSVNSNISLLVDGLLHGAETSDDVFTGAAYRFSKTIHAPLMIGCDTFFNNEVLSEFLKQQNQYFVSNCEVRDVRVYNKYLSYHKIRALTRENKEIQTVKLTLPTGKRTYIDQVVKYYMNRVPGRKSNYFDVNVVSNTITAADVQQLLEQDIKQDIQDKLPVNTYINKINWIS